MVCGYIKKLHDAKPSKLMAFYWKFLLRKSSPTISFESLPTRFCSKSTTPLSGPRPRPSDTAMFRASTSTTNGSEGQSQMRKNAGWSPISSARSIHRQRQQNLKWRRGRIEKNTSIHLMNEYYLIFGSIHPIICSLKELEPLSNRIPTTDRFLIWTLFIRTCFQDSKGSIQSSLATKQQTP